MSEEQKHDANENKAETRDLIYKYIKPCLSLLTQKEVRRTKNTPSEYGCLDGLYWEASKRLILYTLQWHMVSLCWARTKTQENYTEHFQFLQSQESQKLSREKQ